MAGPPVNTMIRAPVLGKVVCLKLRLVVGCKQDRTYLKQTDRNANSDTSAPQRTLIVRDGPRVASEGFEDTGELELTLLGWHEEASSTERLCGDWLARSGYGTVLRAQPKHVLDLLRRVLLPTPEHVGLATFTVSELVDLGLIGKERILEFMTETDKMRDAPSCQR